MVEAIPEDLVRYCTATRAQRGIKQAKTGTGRTVMIAVVDRQIASLGRSRGLYRHFLTAFFSPMSLSRPSRARLNGQKHYARGGCQSQSPTRCGQRMASSSLPGALLSASQVGTQGRGDAQNVDCTDYCAADMLGSCE